jgi:acetyltransferase-like isoleucine patch superfamily enzyme
MQMRVRYRDTNGKERPRLFLALVTTLRVVPEIFAERVAWQLGNFVARRAGAQTLKWSPSIFLNGDGTLELGPSFNIRRGVEFRIFGGEVVRLGNGVGIDNSTILEPNSNGSVPGFINVGEDVFIGAFCQLNGDGGITIGNGTAIGAYARIAANTHEYAADGPLLLRPKTCQGITIGENVFCGSHVSIADGVTIGDYAVIGAGSVVLQSVPARSVAVGAPARIVKTC